MINEKLRDIAYKISTGNHLTERFDYQGFQDIYDISEFMWEPFQYIGDNVMIDQIAQIADEIYGALLAAQEDIVTIEDDTINIKSESIHVVYKHNDVGISIDLYENGLSGSPVRELAYWFDDFGVEGSEDE